MSADIIVAYDGTANDDDALALGRRLTGGASGRLRCGHHVIFSPATDERLERPAERGSRRTRGRKNRLFADSSPVPETFSRWPEAPFPLQT